MKNQLGISEQELHAFVDGELDPSRAEEIAKLIDSDGVVAARIAAFRSDKNRLAHLFEEVKERPLPEAWVLAIGNRPWRLQPSHSTAYLSKRDIFAIAACLLLMLGAGLVFEHFFGSSEDAIVAEALAARQQVMRPQQVFAATTLAEPAERNELITMALAMTLKAPDLSKMGYRLDDIGVFTGLPGGKAVELSYRNPQNRIFTLYVRHPSSPARVDLIQRDGVRICIWQDDVLGAVMLGEMSAGEMARIASLAYAGLTL